GPATGTVARLAALVRGGVDLDAVIAVARSAGPLPATSWSATPWSATEALAQAVPAISADPTPPAGSATPASPLAPSAPVRTSRRPVVAVAGGPAFTFCYTETTELLTAAGADVV